MDQSQTDLPPEVIEKQRNIEPQGEPLLSTQEHDAEEAVDRVLWQHQLERKQRHTGLVRGRKCSTHSLSPSMQKCSLQHSHFPGTDHFRKSPMF